ncbi:hypothetical protein [Sphaerisporangium sp. TRM90804]|uniref:hypothetical protein n=1 Tax=Sphaerisporangium sp. TRM90804 TaxID=3031113 RepID=UPI0024480142|nr:hypothetical protein [Sphaerisporangium sp. TRM90804]MDH2424769.1 hypothetical protein [Sphaerisporangium sp. TRM90804]
MSRPTEIRISISESKGPHMGSVVRDVDENGVEFEYQTIGTATACPGCGKVPLNGSLITKIFGTWWHDRCGAKHLRQMGADQAWLALGMQLERNPNRFTHAETKAIVRNLLKIAHAKSLLGDEPDPADDEIDVGLRQILGGS